MIARKNRFRGRAELTRFFKRAKTFRQTGISLKYSCNNSTWRAAVVVSKKVHKSAVVRNRIRRRIFEIVRKIDEKPNGDYVFLVFDQALKDMPAQDLQNLITKLINQTKNTK